MVRNAIQKEMPMRTVRVAKSELLRRLRDNLEKHVAEYRAACDGYRAIALDALARKRAEVREEFDKLIRRIEGGEVARLVIPVGLGFSDTPPESHEKDYRQIIEMVSMSVEDTVELRTDEFACYVMDDWDWKDEFRATTSKYAGG